MQLHSVYVLIYTTLFIIAAQAVTVNIPLIEDTAADDKERTLNENLTEGWQAENLRVFTLSMTGYATASNNFQSAFGSDTIRTNQILEAEEISVIFAYNGNWEIRLRGLKERYTAAPISTGAGDKTLTVKILVSKSGEPTSIEFKEGTTPITFDGLDLSAGIPDYLRPDTWDMLRVTARGYDDAESPSITSSFKPYGALVIIR